MDYITDAAAWARQAVARGRGVVVVTHGAEPAPTHMVDNPRTPERDLEAWWLVHHDTRSGRATYVSPAYLRLTPSATGQGVDVAPVPFARGAETESETRNVGTAASISLTELSPFMRDGETVDEVKRRLSVEFTDLTALVNNGAATMAQMERHEVLYPLVMQIRDD